MTEEFGFCGKCGAKILEVDQTFCTKCGKPLQSGNGAIESEKVDIIEVKEFEPIESKIYDSPTYEPQVVIKKKVQKPLKAPKKDKKVKHHENLEIYSKGLTKLYGGGKGQSVLAVDAIDLKVEPGVHGFLGPNGAGKTSTINMLIGAISITKGKARIRGKRAGSIKSRRLVGVLTKDPNFYTRMTGEQYLVYMAQLNGIKKHVAYRKTKEILKFLGMSDDKDRKVGKYSGDMKQKIGIGSALIHDPEILILDEPTANLDPIGRNDLIEKIKKLSEKMSVFVSSHILSEIEQMCEMVTMINNGKIIVRDTIKNIKNKHSESANIFVLDTNMNKKVLESVKQKKYVTSAWIDDKDNKIHVVPKDNKVFQESIPVIMAENNSVLKGFFQQEASLQDIFIDIIEGDEKF